jgi:hypothetical protein
LAAGGDGRIDFHRTGRGRDTWSRRFVNGD